MGYLGCLITRDTNEIDPWCQMIGLGNDDGPYPAANAVPHNSVSHLLADCIPNLGDNRRIVGCVGA